MVNAVQKTLEGPPPFEVSIRVAFPGANESAEKLDTGFSLFIAQVGLQDMLLTCLISYLKQITSNLEGDDRLAGLNAVSRLQAILKRTRSSRKPNAYSHAHRCRITLDPDSEVSPKSAKRSAHEDAQVRNNSPPGESTNPVSRQGRLRTLESVSTSASSNKAVKESSDGKQAEQPHSVDPDIEKLSGDQSVGRRRSIVHFDSNADLNASADQDIDRQISAESEVSKASSDDGTHIKTKMVRRIARELASDESPQARSKPEAAMQSLSGIGGDLHKDGPGRRLSTRTYASNESMCSQASDGRRLDSRITEIKIAMAKRMAQEKSKDLAPSAKLSSDTDANASASGRPWTTRNTPLSQTEHPPEIMTASDFATDEDHFTLDMPTKAGQIQPTPTSTLHRAATH